MENIKVGNSQFIRDLNLTGIFNLIHKYGPVSRKELAENTGYSAATISNHVKRLLDSNFVIETDKGSSTGGRRPVYLTVNPDRGYILSVNIEVNQVRIIALDLNFTVKKQLKLDLNKLEPEKSEPEEVLGDLVSQIKDFLAAAELDNNKVIGMGIALPGLVNNEQGLLYFAPNLEWENIEIKAYFQKFFPFPVLIENEAKAAVLGEREFVYPDVDNIVFVSINEGIGCGIIIDGNLYRGAGGNAGEFGHIIIDSDGPKCHCNNYGCWETLASINFITASYFRETGEQIFSAKLQDELLADNQKLQAIVEETGRNIAIGLANIINSLSPEMLVIGGDILNIKKYLAEEINSTLIKKSLAISYQQARIVYSQLGHQASLLGIARMVFDNSIERQIKH